MMSFGHGRYTELWNIRMEREGSKEVRCRERERESGIEVSGGWRVKGRVPRSTWKSDLFMQLTLTTEQDNRNPNCS